MMGATSLPAAQPAMPAGFAAFLANIGQVSPDGGSESGGFDQLLAAAPTAAAPIAGAAAAIRIETALPVDAALPQIETPAETGVTIEAPVAKAEPGQPDAATLAANLLIALNGAVPGAPTAPGKPVPAEPEAETATDIPEPGEAVVAAPATNWAAIVAAAVPAAAPVAAKPAKPIANAPVAADTSAAAAPVAARPRDAAIAVLVGTEPQTTKPAETAPSMTIQFAQPAMPGTATLAHAAAPALVAERVLDMDSDGAWIDQLARDIAATKSDSGDISFRLMPRHLGRLDVAMQMGDEGMSLKMDTHHEATAVIVTAAQGRLVEDLRQQGVRVAGAEVTCTPGEAGRQSQGQNYQGQGRAAAPDPAHLIETATERAEPRDEDRAADRRGRFA